MIDREKVIKGIQECDLNGGLIGNCPYKGILALLKEQEPISPSCDIDGRYLVCGNCGKKIGKSTNYCTKCGRAVKWE